MSEPRTRSILASVVGWLIVIIVIWVLFGSIVGVVGFLIRSLLFLLLVGGLLVLYFKLRDGD